MKSNASAIVDFYEQVALLVRSGFPLPECMRRLQEVPLGTDEHKLFAEIQTRIGNGERLSDVLASHPERFDSLCVKLIRAGEATDSLSEMLYAIARECRFEQFLVGRAKEVTAYPLFVLGMSAVLFIAISVLVMPVLEDAYAEMSLCREVPLLIRLCLNSTHAVRQIWPVLALIVVSCAAGVAWLFSGTILAHRAMMKIMDFVPGTRDIARVLDSARICSMCRLFLERSLPFPEALGAAATAVKLPWMRLAVERAALHCEQGMALPEAVSREKKIPSLIVNTISFKPEEALVGEFGRLQEHYEQEVLAASRDAAFTWTMIGLIIMTVTVLLMVLTIFVPVLNVHQAASLL